MGQITQEEGNRLMKRLWMVFDRIMLCSAVVAGFLLLLITLFVSYSVTLRYMRYNPPIWILQFTEYALLWVTFLGSAWLLRQEKHIRIGFVEWLKVGAVAEAWRSFVSLPKIGAK